MNLSELVKMVSRKTGYPFEEAWAIVDELVGAIVEMLDEGEEVKIRSLGTFRWERSKGKAFKNVRTGQQSKYPTGLKLRFTPGTKLKQRRVLVMKKPRPGGLKWKSSASSSTKTR